MTTIAKRNSADDRRGAPQSSPFRSKAQQKRYVAAMEMVMKRTTEAAAIERLLTRTKDLAEQKRLTTRLLATKNNLKSWQDYIDQHSPREPRAVITTAA